MPHRFPKDATRRRQWLEVAQRDEGSLRMTSCLCSRHFDPSCFVLGEDGQLNLSPDAVPTIILGSIANEVQRYCHSYYQSDILLWYTSVLWHSCVS